MSVMLTENVKSESTLSHKRRDHRVLMKNDLSRDECFALAIKQAFPLPTSGAFADLLSAISEQEDRR